MGIRLQQAQFLGVGYGLNTAARAELAIDVMCMHFYGTYRKEQLLGDLRIGEAVGHEAQHFKFALTEGFSQCLTRTLPILQRFRVVQEFGDHCFEFKCFAAFVRRRIENGRESIATRGC